MQEKATKVVIQLSNDGFDIQKATVAQIHNLFNALESVDVELVVHSHGINLVFQNSHWQHKLESLVKKGARILVCRNTINELNLTENDLLSFVEIIPSAVAHIVVQQQEGWSYLKAGF